MSRYNWPELPNVSSVFEDKVNEINKHLDLLEKLISTSARIRYADGRNTAEYRLQPEDTHPLKSGAVLMIYNFMESVSTELLLDIYQHIRANICDATLEALHNDLKQSIANHCHNRDLFRQYLPRYAHSAQNLDSLMILGWLEKILEEKKETTESGVEYYKWFNGNVDVRQIEKSLRDYSCLPVDFNNLRTNDMPKALLKTKNSRNRLAHGSITFTDFGRDQLLSSIKSTFTEVRTFFTELLNLVNDHLANRQYLESSAPAPRPI